MPVSIVGTLLLWSALLTPGASAHAVPTVVPAPTIAFEPIATIRSWPIRDEGSWALSEADTEEEETGDGDPDGMASEVDRIAPPLRPQGPARSIRLDRGFASPMIRSPILRC